MKRKIYGVSREDNCPFCGRRATTKNEQGMPVCVQHKSSLLDDMKCVCGKYLEMRTGKYGLFFSCIKCGNMSMRKVFEFNAVKEKPSADEIKKKEHSKNASAKEKDNSSDIADNRTADNSKNKKSGSSSKSDDFILSGMMGDAEVVRSDDPRYFD